MLFTRKRIALCAMAAAALLATPGYAQKTSTNAVIAIEKNGRDHTPSSVTFSAQAGYKAGDAATVFRQYLELNPATDEMRLRTTDDASGGIRIARYDQYFRGVKVEHGNYIIAARDGMMSYMSGNFYRTEPALNITPALTEAAALNRALLFTGAKEYMWQVPGADAVLQEEEHNPAATYTPHGQLVLLEDFFAGDEPDGRLHLAWKFDIYATQPLSRSYVYVDAATGKIIFVDAIMKHIAASGRTMYSGTVSFHAKTNTGNYTLHDTTRGNGINTYTLNGATNTSSRAEITSAGTVFDSSKALDVHWGAEKVYDYWATRHNRLSYNNANGALNSYVNYGNNYNNAMWNGNAMVYGNGSGRSGGGFDPLVSLDITGHEIGHGVCQTTAGLVYSRESGAMNEGFSDIWGACIESYADPHEVDAMPKSTWEMGEEIGNTPLRSMANPKLYQNPDTYGGQYWAPATSACIPNSNTNDNCGVHNNSGVLNKWFYLLTVGGTGMNDIGNNYAVPGLGIDTAAIIAYGTELSLANTANYAACRTASINFTTTRFGACSRMVEAVTRAWYAVGVGTDYTPCTAQISFSGTVTSINEGVGNNECMPSHVEQIPIALNGPAPTGGNAVATVTVTGGTAINGVHYAIPVNTVTFPAGSTGPQYLPVTVYDNGTVGDTGLYFDLAVTVAANGSNATLANVFTQTRVSIAENDAAPAPGGTDAPRNTTGSSAGTNSLSSPFQSKYAQARIQYIFTAAELRAIGIKPRAALTRATFFLTQKRSTQQFTDYTLKLGHTTATTFTTSFMSGLTQVFNGNVTTAAGANNISFSNSFVWDGTSNLVMEICFGNAAADTANDYVTTHAALPGKTAFAGDNGTGGGCNLAFSTANITDMRPLVRFVQEFAPSHIATASGDTRIWNVASGKEAYFYTNADTGAIAGLINGSSDLGCTTATITADGNGFRQAAFAGVNRSLKELTLSGVAIPDTAAYDAIMYVTDAELSGQDPAGLHLVKTTAATDAAVSWANTQIVASPVLISGSGFKGFKGAFTGAGRFFLTDGLPNLGVQTMGPGSDIHVNNNPFRDQILLSASLPRGEQPDIRLYDVTGKLVYREQHTLPAGKSVTGITVGGQLAPGHYVLQVICSGRVYTQKLLRQ